MGSFEVVDWPPYALCRHTPICLSRQAPLAALSLGALRQGLGWYGQHNGVRNIADRLKSLHTCPKRMDNAFYGGGCPYFGRLVQYYGLDKAILAQIKVCLAAIMGQWRQVRDMETPPAPQNPLYVSLNEDGGL